MTDADSDLLISVVSSDCDNDDNEDEEDEEGVYKGEVEENEEEEVAVRRNRCISYSLSLVVMALQQSQVEEVVLVPVIVLVAKEEEEEDPVVIEELKDEDEEEDKEVVKEVEEEEDGDSLLVVEEEEEEVEKEDEESDDKLPLRSISHQVEYHTSNEFEPTTVPRTELTTIVNNTVRQQSVEALHSSLFTLDCSPVYPHSPPLQRLYQSSTESLHLT